MLVESQGNVEVLNSVLGSLTAAVEQLKDDSSSEKLHSVITNTVGEISKQATGKISAEVLDAINNAILGNNSLSTNSSEDQAQIKEVLANNLKALHDDMQQLMAHNAAMHSDIRLTKQEFAKHSAMLETIIIGEHRVPTMMIVVPKKPRSIFGQMKRVFNEKVHIYFVCPMTMRLGLPYELILPQQWIVKVAPLIKLSLMLLKIGLTCAGLPIPIPQFNLGENIFFDMLRDMERMLDVEQLENADFVDSGISELMDSIDLALLTVKALTESNDIAVRKINAQKEKLAKSTKSSYAEVHRLLKSLEAKNNPDRDDWIPLQTGLVRVTSRCDGMTAWILNNPVVVENFHKEGVKSLRVI
jgi:hypothetical protein